MMYNPPYHHLPGRVMHIRELELLNQRRNDIAAPWGLLGGYPPGVAPGPLPVAPPASVPRQVRYPLHVCARPGRDARHIRDARQYELCPVMDVRQHESVLSSDHAPLGPLPENFFQLAWQKGIERDKKLDQSHTSGSKKRKSRAANAEKVSSKEDVSKRDSDPSAIFLSRDTGHSKPQSLEAYLAAHWDAQKNRDMEVTKELSDARKNGEMEITKELSDARKNGEMEITKEPSDARKNGEIGITKEPSDAQKNGEMERTKEGEELEEGEIAEDESAHEVASDSLLQIGKAEEQAGEFGESCLSVVLDMEGVNNIEHELRSLDESVSFEAIEADTANTAFTLDHEESRISSSEASNGLLIKQSQDCANGLLEETQTNQINAVCSPLGLQASCMKGLEESLIPEALKACQEGNNPFKSRDPRQRPKDVSSMDPAGSACPLEENRIHEREEDVEMPAPSKRQCLEEVRDSQLDTDFVSVSEGPVGMEIDSVGSLQVILSNAVEICSEVINPSKDTVCQSPFDAASKTMVVAEGPKVRNPTKPTLKSRDPRRALLDRDKASSINGCSTSPKAPTEAVCVPNGLASDRCIGGMTKHDGSNKTGIRRHQKESKPLASRGHNKGFTSWENVHLEGLTEEQREAVYVERARRIDEQNRMLNSKKLCLVLDLDHTLLNSTKFSEVDNETNGILMELDQFSKQDLYCYPKLGMWTKLRPGIWDFLARASQLYELHVYTMGNKAYATEMAKLLDPTGTLFAGRVISKGDEGEGDPIPKSKDLDGVLGLESAVLIIDDSVNVWPHHRHNLLVVERYMYFPSSRRQFGLSGESLLEIKHDERAADGMLASVLKVIERVHEQFFSNERLHELDVRGILATEKQSVLAGCRILFSRVFPQDESQPHLHPLWQTAEQFGAVCTTNLDDGVTHVVAISRGTEKVKWAVRTGRFAVPPAWLEASTVLYRRANESDFLVPL